MQTYWISIVCDSCKQRFDIELPKIRVSIQDLLEHNPKAVQKWLGLEKFRKCICPKCGFLHKL